MKKVAVILKVAIIGAGSAVFWLSLTRDFCTMKSAPGSTITLVDIDKERLDAVYRLGSRYIKDLGVDIKLEKTQNRREAMKEADFVVNTAMPGGHEHQEAMRAAGIKHGYYMGIDNAEHNFVWDYFTILGFKQYKLALDIAKDMEEICPDAWLMQTANPIFEVTTLLRRHSKIKAAGFCPGYHAVHHLMFVTGISPAETDFQVAGFNHSIYLTRFKNRETGEDLYPAIDRWAKNDAPELWKITIWVFGRRLSARRRSICTRFTADTRSATRRDASAGSTITIWKQRSGGMEKSAGPIPR